jgi:hypothetical protein
MPKIAQTDKVTVFNPGSHQPSYPELGCSSQPVARRQSVYGACGLTFVSLGLFLSVLMGISSSKIVSNPVHFTTTVVDGASGKEPKKEHWKTCDFIIVARGAQSVALISLIQV